LNRWEGNYNGRGGKKLSGIPGLGSRGVGERPKTQRKKIFRKLARQQTRGEGKTEKKPKWIGKKKIRRKKEQSFLHVHRQDAFKERRGKGNDKTIQVSGGWGGEEKNIRGGGGKRREGGKSYTCVPACDGNTKKDLKEKRKERDGESDGSYGKD